MLQNKELHKLSLIKAFTIFVKKKKYYLMPVEVLSGTSRVIFFELRRST